MDERLRDRQLAARSVVRDVYAVREGRTLRRRLVLLLPGTEVATTVEFVETPGSDKTKSRDERRST